MWKLGVDELIKRIKPSIILIYGGKLDYDYGKIEVKKKKIINFCVNYIE